MKKNRLPKYLLISFLIFTGTIFISSCKEEAETKTENTAASAAQPETASHTDYKVFIEKLDKNKLASVSEALNYYKTNANNFSQAEKDSNFLLFRDFYNTMREIHDSLLYENQKILDKLYASNVLFPDENITDQELKDYLNTLKQNGFEINATEGSYYIGEQPDYLSSGFTPYVTQPFKEFLAIMKKEIEEGYASDGGLIIEFDNLAERAYTWENFMTKYPDFPLKDEAWQTYKTYMYTLLKGMDNTPLFDYDTQILMPEIKKIYQEFPKKYPQAETSRILTEFYTLLESNNFRKNPQAEQFYNEKFGESF